MNIVVKAHAVRFPDAMRCLDRLHLSHKSAMRTCQFRLCVFAKTGGIWQFFPQRERGFDFQFLAVGNTLTVVDRRGEDSSAEGHPKSSK
jgi:hypothetical protein